MLLVGVAGLPARLEEGHVGVAEGGGGLLARGEHTLLAKGQDELEETQSEWQKEALHKTQVGQRNYAGSRPLRGKGTETWTETETRFMYVVWALIIII